jgi:hypothetical protein
MPVKYDEDSGKWCFGSNCTFSSKGNAEKAETAYYASMNKKRVSNTDLAKSVDEDKRIFTSIVLKANQYDNDGENQDYWSEDVIEKAAWDFMENCQKHDIQHMIDTDDIFVVESYISPVDFPMGDGEVNKGDWVMSVKILDNDLWDMCKEGIFKGFSVGCSALVEEEDDD